MGRELPRQNQNLIKKKDAFQSSQRNPFKPPQFYMGGVA